MRIIVGRDDQVHCMNVHSLLYADFALFTESGKCYFQAW